MIIVRVVPFFINRTSDTPTFLYLSPSTHKSNNLFVMQILLSEAEDCPGTSGSALETTCYRYDAFLSKFGD